jgi:hypothetical protein
MNNINHDPAIPSSGVAAGDQDVAKGQVYGTGASRLTVTQRPGLECLIQDTRRGKLDTLIPEDLDRIYRRIWVAEGHPQSIMRRRTYPGKITYRHSPFEFVAWLMRKSREAISLCR